MDRNTRRRFVYAWLRKPHVREWWEGHETEVIRRYRYQAEIPDWLMCVVAQAKIDGVYSMKSATVDVASWIARKIERL